MPIVKHMKQNLKTRLRICSKTESGQIRTRDLQEKFTFSTSILLELMDTHSKWDKGVY